MSAIVRDPLLAIRPMTGDDLGTVIEIERRAYAFPWTEGIFGDCLRVGYSCWVFSLDRRVIGYGVMSVAAGESHILNVCVDREFRRLGLGRKMMHRLLNIARQKGADTAFLEVRPSNRAALDLYQSLGFNEIGRRPGYYPARQGREDALVLACSL